MVVGAGRGPLVRAALSAANSVGIVICIIYPYLLSTFVFAVENLHERACHERETFISFFACIFVVAS